MSAIQRFTRNDENSLKVLINQGLRRATSVITSVILALAPGLQNVSADAQPRIVIDNRGLDGHRIPALDRARNGVQQLNIARPNAAGLSHNVFKEYGVEARGLILNNATQRTQSALGGMITGNPNFNGHAAHTILNEVSGRQASQMLGYTEVAGQRAHVIIANPNGITCNGCGFINTTRVSLAAGPPELDAAGRLQAMTVRDGLIAFQGKGGDFSTVPILDIFSRRVLLDADVHGQNINLVVGRNKIDMQSGVVRKLYGADDSASQYAVDSTAFGGIFAGRISMTVNEAGAGVHVNNTLAANAGDLTITADKQLVVSGALQARDAINLQAPDLDVPGKVQAGGAVAEAVAGRLANRGEMSAGQGVKLATGQLQNNGLIASGSGYDLNLNVSNLLDNHGTMTVASGNIVIDAGRVTNAQGAKILAKKGLTARIHGDLDNEGSIGASAGDVRVNADGALRQTTGVLSAASGALNVNADSVTNLAAAYLSSGAHST